MTARLIHRGDMVDYTPSTDVAAGAVVVQGDLVGIAVRPIAANTLGALIVTGVIEAPKASGTTINAGAFCYWDADNNRVTTSSSGTKYLGKAVATAAEADTRVCVRLSQ